MFFSNIYNNLQQKMEQSVLFYEKMVFTESDEAEEKGRSKVAKEHVHIL